MGLTLRRTARRISRLKGVRVVIPSGYSHNLTPGLLLLSLAVHNMAHTVINDAPLSAASGEESLPGAAYSVGEELREWRESLAAVVGLLDQIADLEPD